jgi:hypothetical protein
MAEHSFHLIPFPDAHIPDIKIAGRISRRHNTITVHYELAGGIDTILFPETSNDPGRKDDLWKATCFEFFLALPGQPQYWEFNISPSGDWNVYHMDAYRRIGLREEAAISQLPFSFLQKPDCVIVETILDLSPIVQERQPVHAGITCVIQEKNGHETYWALTHPGSTPDFHRRESFMLSLAG